MGREQLEPPVTLGARSSNGVSLQRALETQQLSPGIVDRLGSTPTRAHQQVTCPSLHLSAVLQHTIRNSVASTTDTSRVRPSRHPVNVVASRGCQGARDAKLRFKAVRPQVSCAHGSSIALPATGPGVNMMHLDHGSCEDGYQSNELGSKESCEYSCHRNVVYTNLRMKVSRERLVATMQRPITSRSRGWAVPFDIFSRKHETRDLRITRRHPNTTPKHVFLEQRSRFQLKD